MRPKKLITSIVLAALLVCLFSFGAVGGTQSRHRAQTHHSHRISGGRHYTNAYGRRVQSPRYSRSVPAGATAQCNDGTYSFSQSRRGTCSHHGGVRTWLR